MSDPAAHVQLNPPSPVDGQGQIHAVDQPQGPSCCGGSCSTLLDTAPASDASARLIFQIQGLDCAEEVAILKRVLGPLVGGEEHLGFDVLNGRMLLLEGAADISAEALQRAVATTGMKARQWDGAQTGDNPADRHARIQARYTFASGVFVFAGLVLHIVLSGGFTQVLRLFTHHEGPGVPAPELLAYIIAIALGGRFVIVKAWYAAKSLRPDINLLMVVAVSGAIGIGQWFEAAAVAFLFSLSLTLESWSVGRARRAISALLQLAPSVVRVREADAEEREVPAAEVAVGTRFIVHPGERIALDGQVVSGSSSVDQAPITGESVPVEKGLGALVFAGTINGDGALEVVSNKAANDTTLSRIIRMVEEASGRRARVDQWVERFARVYTPAIILLALAVFVLPPLLFGGTWSDWFYRALVLLVIGCPCALVISTPVSIVAALAAAARNGVLIKGGIYIEQPSQLKAVAFDKTGTLTHGRPVVVQSIPLNGYSETELLVRAAALEARSNHPLARAVTEWAEEKGVTVRAADAVQALPGKGVEGVFEGERLWLGSHRYLQDRGQETPAVRAQAVALEGEGKTVVVIGNERHVCGMLAIADTVRVEAAATLQALRERGVEHLVMLTGDNRTTANAVAARVGIDEVHAELLPEDKVHVVEQLVNRYGTVAMVGDGVNDAPAMARASFGIAMGGAGSDAAIETADIALMTDDLRKLPLLHAHSRRTLGIIRQNIGFALLIKAAFVLLTFLGYGTLWGAILADVGATLLVVSNALRLLRLRAPVVA